MKLLFKGEEVEVVIDESYSDTLSSLTWRQVGVIYRDVNKPWITYREEDLISVSSCNTP